MNINTKLFDLIKNHKWKEFIEIINKIDDIDLNIRDEYHNYLIQYGVIYNNFQIVTEILKKKIRLDIKDSDGRTILYFPIKFNYIDILNELLNYDENVVGLSIIEAKDLNKYTPLHYSIIFNNFDAFKLLINKGASLESIDKFGNNSLGVAIDYERINFINYLLKMQVNVNHINSNGETPIVKALFMKKLSVVNILLEIPNLNFNIYENENKISPLIIACNFGLNEIITRIINKKIDFDHQDYDGNTALHYSVIEKNWYIIDLLIEKTNTNLFNLYGKTVLHIIFDDFKMEEYNDNKINIIKKIISKSNINIQDQNGNTVLFLIVKNNMFDIFQNELENKKLDLFIRNKDDNYIYEFLDKKFLDVVSKSYYNLLKQNKEWKNDWENECKINIKNKNDCLITIKKFIIENNKSFPIKKIETDMFLDNGIYVNRCSYVGVGLDLVCGLIFLKNNFDNITTTLTTDFEENKDVENYYDSLGISSTFKTNFLNFEILWIYQKIFFPSNFNIVISKFLNSNKKYMIIPIGIEINIGSHANVLIWDRDKKTIERFEPYGKSYPNNYYYNSFLLDNMLISKFKSFDENIIYKSPDMFLPFSSFQSLESKEDIYCSKIGDPNGFCAIWCIWWVYHRLNNKDISVNKLATKLIKKIKKHNFYFRNLIRNFSSNVTTLRDNLLSKSNIDINDWINNNYTIEQYNKIIFNIKTMID